MADTSFLDSIDWGKLQALLSGSANASAQGNIAEGNYLNNRDRISAEMYNTQSTAANRAAQLGLDTSKYVNSLSNQGYGEAVRGSLLQNMQDVTPVYGGPSGKTITSFSGGARPSALGPEARAAGGALAAHGGALLADPSSFAPTVAAPLAPPALSAEPSAGFWGQATGAGATTAGILNAIGKGANAASGSGSGAGGDLKKLWDLITGHHGSDVASEEDSPQHQEEDTRDMTSATGGTAYGPDGLPLAGQGFNPEDPSTAAANWWDQLPLTDPTAGGGGGSGGDEYGPEPSDSWGG